MTCLYNDKEDSLIVAFIFLKFIDFRDQRSKLKRCENSISLFMGSILSLLKVKDEWHLAKCQSYFCTLLMCVYVYVCVNISKEIHFFYSRNYYNGKWLNIFEKCIVSILKCLLKYNCLLTWLIKKTQLKICAYSVKYHINNNY